MDVKKLETGLKELTGLDFKKAEKNVRAKGDTTPVIQLSMEFQLELAAIALNENPNELLALPLNKFNQVLSKVQNFLYDFSDEETTPAEK